MIIPYLDSRIELIPILEGIVPDSIKIHPLNNSENIDLYEKLITKVLSNFSANNNIYTFDNMVSSYNKMGQIYPEIQSLETFFE